MPKIELKEKYPLLPKSYKGLFPFRICAPSFIYPAAWSENAKLLAPYLDEVELLFLESRFPDSFPSATEIETLRHISETHGLTYNIHLPTDISLGAPSRVQQEITVDALKKAVALSESLCPSTYTLHLAFDEASREKATLQAWQARIIGQLGKLLSWGIPSGKISIETLDYPFDWVADIITDLNLGICMDVGHLIVHGKDSADFYNRFQSRIDIIHLHGVQGQTDHLLLSPSTMPQKKTIIDILTSFDKTLSLEVFSYRDLSASLNWINSLNLSSLHNAGLEREGGAISYTP